MAISPMEQFEIRPLVPMHLFGYDVSFTNASLFMCLVVAATTLFFVLALMRPKHVPGRMQSMAEISYEFVANMIHSTMGKDGLAYFPFVFAIFFFVLFSNFIGLVPWSFTVTSQILVTFALTVLVLTTVVIVGFIKHGIGFLMLFVPKAPWYLIWLLIPIEIISFLTRLVSLSVRLFANMLAGHTMLAIFAGFVIILGGAGGIYFFLASTPLLMVIFLAGLEMLVAFLQAYVFAILTCIYLNEALHLHGGH